MSAKADLILLHGALGCKKHFDDLIPLLSGNFNVHTFDFKGHGMYAANDRISAEMLCQQLENFIREKSIAGAHIFAYSMGGYVALMTCINESSLIGNLITLATKLEWSETIAKKEIEQLDYILGLPEDHTFIKQLINFHSIIHYKNTISNVKVLMSELGQNQYINKKSVTTIKNKIIMLIGSQDTMVSVEETKNICDSLPNATLQLLEETKHPFEKVNKVLLAEFIISNLC